jgi:hypothetical protein
MERRLTTSPEELLNFAARDLAQGARPADVVEMLVKNGATQEEAEVLVHKLGGVIHGQRSSDGLGSILVGGLLLALGGGATVLSMTGGNGSGVLFYGAILAGLLSIGRGVFRMFG